MPFSFVVSFSTTLPKESSTSKTAPFSKLNFSPEPPLFLVKSTFPEITLSLTSKFISVFSVFNSNS